MSPDRQVIPVSLSGPALFDTGVWAWARDRRYPHLAEWFNEQAAAGRILVCDLTVLELVRVAPNQARAREVAERLDAFEHVPMPGGLWSRAREIQLLLSEKGDHRRVPPADLLFAVAAEHAGVTLIHYDRDYERIGSVTSLRHEWFVADDSLA